MFRIWLAVRRRRRKACRIMGAIFGTAFQVIDDLLDYNADGEQLGKNVATI
ncbi:polyprenyl synthetase family protein [Escherichia coli]